MGRRYNIGLVVAAIEDSFSNNLAKGVMKYAEKLDVNLMIFPCKYVGITFDGTDRKYEYQYNTLLSCAADAKLDYVIVATGTIAYAASDEIKNKILERFGSTPVLNVASNLPGYDFLLFDNRSGVTEAMENLIAQGRKHIAMLRGDMRNYDAKERYEAYRNALEKHNLDYDETYSIDCDMSEYCTESVEKLLDNNPLIDAIICVNDQIAQAVYRVLNARGIEIGSEIAVVGFDDQPFASRMEPPLASVRADAFKMGELAMEKAVNYLNGIVDDRHLVETDFVARHSCYPNSDSYEVTDAIFMCNSARKAENVTDYLFGDKEESELKIRVKSILLKFFEALDSYFVNGVGGIEEYRQIEGIIDHIFYGEVSTENNIDIIQNAIDGAYRYYYDRCKPENFIYLQRLYNYFYRRVNLAVAVNYRSLADKTKERMHFDNIVLGDMLMMSGNLEDSCSSMIKRLHIIGADTAFLYLLENPIVNTRTDQFPINITWKFMSYVYGNTVFTVPKHEQRMTTPMVFANSHLNYGRRSTLIVIDLFCKEKQYGIILCEPKTTDFFNEVEFVSHQISSAINSMYLLRAQEAMLMELHSKNLSLDNMSKIDELTGIFNRRGFYAEADSLIAANPGTKYLVAYADMDNLKLVNDHYGHGEGDFSIKSLAECLRAILGEKAVLGRMGGDEFAAIMQCDDNCDVQAIMKAKEKQIEILNSKAGKPYRIDMSVGLVVCECSNSYDLKENIDKADGMLYNEKTKRKKEI